MIEAPLPGRGGDLEPVHQPAGTQEPDRRAGRGGGRTVEDGLEVFDPRPALADTDHQARRRVGLDQELHCPSARILESVARNLTRRGCDPRLVERGEAQKAGDLAGALPRQHDVAFEADFQGEDPHVIEVIDPAPPWVPFLGDQDRHVVMLPPEVAVEDSGDHARVPRRQPGIAIEGPLRGQPVGVHDQKRTGNPTDRQTPGPCE